jgi:uncharacterized small protein (DUF1192 family)
VKPPFPPSHPLGQLMAAVRESRAASGPAASSELAEEDLIATAGKIARDGGPIEFRLDAELVIAKIVALQAEVERLEAENARLRRKLEGKR